MNDHHARIFHFLLPLLLSLLFIQSVSSELCNYYDKEVLLQMKNQLGNPLSLQTWDPNTDCCSDWQASFSWTVQIDCDNRGNVVGLWIHEAEDLTGDILLPALANLTSLEMLKLTNMAKLSTTIPPAIGHQLTNLQSLTITNTNLTGPIIGCLSHLNKLKELDLSWNNLTGEIPDWLGQLPNLVVVRLNGNKLHGTLPEFSSSRNGIYCISASYNNLSGPIPESLGLLSNLSMLLLHGNQFNGSIPPSIGLLASLRLLDLSSNQLTGPIPENFGSLTNSIELFLDDNHLNGSLPKLMCRLNPMTLSLSNNNLTGDASCLFEGDKSWMETMNLSKNRFKFNFSNVDLSRFTQDRQYLFRNLNVSHNKIYGSLPSLLGQFPYLRTFDVSYNRLCGPIPTGLQWDKSSFAHNKCLCGPPLAPCR